MGETENRQYFVSSKASARAGHEPSGPKIAPLNVPKSTPHQTTLIEMF